MFSVLLLLLLLLQQNLISAQEATVAGQRCLCTPGATCPPGSSGIDLRIVNQGTVCSSGYVYCCSNDNTNNVPCGTRRIAPSAHPVGQAARGAYPWQVAILNNNNVIVGGGVLISPTHVFTVAHKVEDYVNGGIKVRLGAWNVQATNEQSVDINVIRVVLHPQYSPQNFMTNDIAVLKLSSAAPIATNLNINTACLPNAVPNAGKRCWVTGWGTDAFGSNGYQSILKEVDVPVVDRAICQTSLQTARPGLSLALGNSFICAGGKAGKDACTGDGGSPLVCSRSETDTEPYQVVGLVTWGIGCATAEVPGVYTNVYNFLDWIRQQISSL